MPDRSDPVFDPAPLEEFASREQIVEILDAFTEHCDRVLPELATAVRERRREAIDRAAHALAGSSGTVGAPAVAAAARALCALARGEADAGHDGAGLGAALDMALRRLLDAAAEARAAIDRYVAAVQ